MKDFWSENLNIKRLNLKKITVAMTTLVIILLIIVIGIIYIVNPSFREWIDIKVLQKETTGDEVSIIEYNSDANVEICTYDKYIGVLSKNKFEIYNSYGKVENSLDIPINNATFSSSNRFLGIAENGGQNIYLVSGQNLLWENKVEGNVSKICVNRNGYMAVVIADTNYKTVVSLFNSNGKELFKIYLSSSRVADVTISNDNKYLALAEIDTTSSIIKSNVKIISIENAQNDAENSVDFIHNAETNKLLINIKYQDKNRLLCMYDNSIDMIQDKNNTEMINFSDRKISFSTVEMNSGIAIVEEKSSGLFTADSELSFINIENQRETMYTAKDVTKEIYSSGDVVGLNLGSELHFVNKGGWLIKKYVANQEISKVYLSEVLAAIVYRDKIEIVNF